jgi:hypothetical protein
VIEGGIVQILDPFTLQAFVSYQVQHHSQLCVTLIDKYVVDHNLLWGYGRRVMFCVEMDYESKSR